MTIAACHVSPEGVVLGTDSTSTLIMEDNNGRQHKTHLDYEQKLFEIGPPGSTFGLATYGQGRIAGMSHRTVAAKLGRQHDVSPFASVEAMARHLGTFVWDRLEAAHGPDMNAARPLLAQAKAAEAAGAPNPLNTTEQQLLRRTMGITRGGYFVAGRLLPGDDCEAYCVEWSLEGTGPNVSPVPQEMAVFKGVPLIMERIVLGYDARLVQNLKASGKWSGTIAELETVLGQSNLIQPNHLPLREAVDWIHTVIHTTIRAIKFAKDHSCGGPVEIAAITTDRPFRWVCHKPLDAALITSRQ